MRGERRDRAGRVAPLRVRRGAYAIASRGRGGAMRRRRSAGSAADQSGDARRQAHQGEGAHARDPRPARWLRSLKPRSSPTSAPMARPAPTRSASCAQAPAPTSCVSRYACQRDVVGHEGRDEIIAVVVALAPVERQRDAGVARRPLEQLRLELLVEERVGVADIDSSSATRAPPSISATASCSPRRSVGAKIAAKRLLAPWHLARRDDRRERAHRPEPARVAERDGQRAMPAHRMAGDRPAGHVDRKVARQARAARR